MEPEQAAPVRPPLTTYAGLAKMIDHSLVRPELTDADIAAGCQVALDYDVASVSARPSDADLVVRLLAGSDVKPGGIVGFPHGNTTTPAKLYELRDLLRRGIREIDTVLNIGKLLSRQFQYIEMELMQMARACHEEGAILKVITENCYLTEDLKVIACKIAKRAEVDFVKTSTAFGPGGYTLDDLRLMKRVCGGLVKVKAAGGVRTLDAALAVYAVGCDRFGATRTAEILDAWKARLAAQPPVVS